MEITAEPNSEEVSSYFEVQEEYSHCLFNILDDFYNEKEKLEKLQRASMNILEDFDEERIKLQNVQQETNNLLDKINEEKIKLEQTQRAVMNILDDIETEQQKTEQANKLLELTNKELEAFSYSVSHDLQAPLRAINGFAQAVVEDYSSKLDSEGQRFLGLIQKNACLMNQLIHDLLAFSRLGRQQMRVIEVNMETLAMEVFEELKAQIPDKKVQFKLSTLPQVMGDPALIRQVLVNLLSNALKFTGPCELAIIEVGYRQEKDKAVFYVKDNGVGFDMLYIDKLFGVFQRLHSTEEFEGTGIGLALVKRIINRHGGSVWAEGAINQGACFYFTLSPK